MGFGFPFSGKLQRLEHPENVHKPEIRRQNMAKSDSFFIRAKIDNNGALFNEIEIDLGSFVNLGISKSTLLRIHNIQAQYLDVSAPEDPIFDDTGSPGAIVRWQLTTQTQATLVEAADKSFVSGGTYHQVSTPGNLVQPPVETADMNLHEWTNGYLVGVDSMFLAADSSVTWSSGPIRISVVLECTLENATQANSVALALSQQ
jgi:hypothetical protein